MYVNINNKTHDSDFGTSATARQRIREKQFFYSIGIQRCGIYTEKTQHLENKKSHNKLPRIRDRYDGGRT